MNQIFISHSRRDKLTIEHLVNYFDDRGVKPVLMELERWSRNRRPNWIWIRDEIKASNALFLLPTKNIVKIPQTQNWISFEIGVASMCNPSLPVFVFKEENVHFPVPYLSHYFDQPISKMIRIFSKDPSETLLNVLVYAVQGTFIDVIIENPNIVLSEDETTLCENCLLRFHYWGEGRVIECPCCLHIITISGPNMKDILRSG